MRCGGFWRDTAYLTNPFCSSNVLICSLILSIFRLYKMRPYLNRCALLVGLDDFVHTKPRRHKKDFSAKLVIHRFRRLKSDPSDFETRCAPKLFAASWLRGFVWNNLAQSLDTDRAIRAPQPMALR